MTTHLQVQSLGAALQGLTDTCQQVRKDLLVRQPQQSQNCTYATHAHKAECDDIDPSRVDGSTTLIKLGQAISELQAISQTVDCCLLDSSLALCEWVQRCACILLRLQELLDSDTVEDGAPCSGDPAESQDGDEWVLVPAAARATQNVAVEMTQSLHRPDVDYQESIRTTITELDSHIASLHEAILPTIKADIADFTASNVPEAKHPYLPPPLEDLKTERSIYANPPSQPHPHPDDLTSLRTRLYALKDTLQESQDALDRLLHPHPHTRRARAMPEARIGDSEGGSTSDLHALLQAQCLTINALSEYLSNNATEWIDSMLSGKLSYSEFVALNQQEIVMMTRGLKDRNLLARGLVLEREGRRGVRTRRIGVGQRELVLELDANDGGQVEGNVDVGSVLGVEMWRQEIEGLNWMLKVRGLE